MQFIRQDSKIDGKNLTKLLDKYGRIQVGLNGQAISDDIDKLKDLAERNHNKIYVKNCWRLVDYLEKLMKVTKEGAINIAFQHDGKFIVSRPIEVRKFADFNIQTTDYIDVMGKSVVTFDYSKLMDALAFEIGYFDLGHTDEEIEQKLENIGIVATYDASEIADVVDERAYRVLYNLRIEDSPYLSTDRKYMTDYYGARVNDRISYIGTLDSTARKTMSLIVADVLSEALDNKYNIEVAGVYEDSLVLLVGNDTDVKEVSTKLAKSQTVRLFGRKFQFKPDIQIY